MSLKNIIPYRQLIYFLVKMIRNRYTGKIQYYTLPAVTDDTFIRAIFVFPFVVRYSRIRAALTNARSCTSMFVLL